MLSLLEVALAKYLNKGKMMIGLLKKTVAKYCIAGRPYMKEIMYNSNR